MDTRDIKLPDPDSKVIRRLLETMTESVNDDVDQLVEDLLTEQGFEVDWSDDGEVEAVELPLVDKIYTMLGQLIAGMSDND